MAQRIVMPSFGMYTAEGTLGEWLRPAGSTVAAGDLIVEIVTEKATYEVEAPAAGVLHPVAAPGEPLVVEKLIGWILADGEPAPRAAGEASPSRVDEAAVPPSATTRDAPPAGAGSPATDQRPAARAAGRIVASPAARRLAAARGVDLVTLTGSGPGGRIVEADVVSAATDASSSVARSAPTATGAAAAPLPWRVRESIPLTGMRRTIAERLRRSVDTAVALTLTREIRAEALVAARRALAPRLAADVPYDALLAKALADALRERPELNATIAGDAIHLLDEIHVGFAVSVPGGLVVPVLRDAGARSLAEVAGDVRELAARARAGALLPEHVLGATVTISNLGAHGVDAFTPVLNPPQSAILGVGRIAARPVVERDGRLAAGTTCVLSLTFDHRVTDGAPAADLLAAVARRLEDASWLEALA